MSIKNIIPKNNAQKILLTMLFGMIFLTIAAACNATVPTEMAVPSTVPIMTDTPTLTALPPTTTPTVTPTPCVEPVHPIAIGDLRLYLHCDVEDPEAIIKVLTNAESLQPAAGDYHVFGEKDKKGAEEISTEWNTAHNMQDFASFGRGGGQTWPGLVVIYQGDYWGWVWKTSEQEYLVAHEYQHLVQYELSGTMPGQLPAWFEEGFAYLLAEKQIIQLEGKSDYIAYGCDTIPPLSNLVNWGTVKDSACPYVAGYDAARKMFYARKLDGYLALLGAIRSGSSFDAAFKQIYGISTADFYKGVPLPTP